MPKVNHLDNNIKLEGKRVLIRTDFNVPISNGQITSTIRIDLSMKTINYILSNAK